MSFDATAHDLRLTEPEPAAGLGGRLPSRLLLSSVSTISSTRVRGRASRTASAVCSVVLLPLPIDAARSDGDGEMPPAAAGPSSVVVDSLSAALLSSSSSSLSSAAAASSCSRPGWGPAGAGRGGDG
ncbi:hypothetical protein VTH06DRAFT_382 [Thermothelomyces fergusii]